VRLRAVAMRAVPALADQHGMRAQFLAIRFNAQGAHLIGDLIQHRIDAAAGMRRVNSVQDDRKVGHKLVGYSLAERFDRVIVAEKPARHMTQANEKPCVYREHLRVFRATTAGVDRRGYRAGVPPNFRQEVVYVQYDAAMADFWAKVGEERVSGLQHITQQLAATGWRIVTVMPLSWSSAAGGAGLSFGPTSTGGVMEFVLFVTRDSDRDTRRD
jgi:hypothetical protein